MVKTVTSSCKLNSAYTQGEELTRKKAIASSKEIISLLSLTLVKINWDIVRNRLYVSSKKPLTLSSTYLLTTLWSSKFEKSKNTSLISLNAFWLFMLTDVKFYQIFRKNKGIDLLIEYHDLSQHQPSKLQIAKIILDGLKAGHFRPFQTFSRFVESILTEIS